MASKAVVDSGTTEARVLLVHNLRRRKRNLLLLLIGKESNSWYHCNYCDVSEGASAPAAATAVIKKTVEDILHISRKGLNRVLETCYP